MLRRLLKSVGVQTILGIGLLVGSNQGWLGVDRSGQDRAAKEGSISATVTLPFKSERFHIAKIQAEGRVHRVNGNVVELRSINANGIRALAGRHYWIGKIEGV
jgi:hypothetical protein